MRAELVVERGIGCSVQDALVAVPVVAEMSQLLLSCVKCDSMESDCYRRLWTDVLSRVVEGAGSLLVGDEDLPAVDDLRQRDGLVLLPVLNGLVGVDEDDKVIILALVVDLGLSVGTARRHCGGVVRVVV